MNKKRQLMIRKAAELHALKARAAILETGLQLAIGDYCSSQFGLARSLAAEIGFSDAYICDVRKGNRGLGDDVVGKIAKLPGAPAACRKGGGK